MSERDPFISSRKEEQTSSELNDQVFEFIDPERGNHDHNRIISLFAAKERLNTAGEKSPKATFYVATIVARHAQEQGITLLPKTIQTIDSVILPALEDKKDFKEDKDAKAHSLLLMQQFSELDMPYSVVIGEAGQRKTEYYIFLLPRAKKIIFVNNNGGNESFVVHQCTDEQDWQKFVRADAKKLAAWQDQEAIEIIPNELEDRAWQKAVIETIVGDIDYKKAMIDIIGDDKQIPGSIFTYAQEHQLALPEKIEKSEVPIVRIGRRRFAHADYDYTLEKESNTYLLSQVLKKNNLDFHIIRFPTRERAAAGYCAFVIPEINKTVLAIKGKGAAFVVHGQNPEDILNRSKNELKALQPESIVTIVGGNTTSEGWQEDMEIELKRSNPEGEFDINTLCDRKFKSTPLGKKTIQELRYKYGRSPATLDSRIKEALNALQAEKELAYDPTKQLQWYYPKDLEKKLEELYPDLRVERLNSEKWLTAKAMFRILKKERGLAIDDSTVVKKVQAMTGGLVAKITMEIQADEIMDGDLAQLKTELEQNQQEFNYYQVVSETVSTAGTSTAYHIVLAKRIMAEIEKEYGAKIEKPTDRYVIKDLLLLFMAKFNISDSDARNKRCLRARIAKIMRSLAKANRADVIEKMNLRGFNKPALCATADIIPIIEKDESIKKIQNRVNSMAAK